MSGTTTLEFDRLPALAAQFGKGLVARKQVRAGEAVGRIEARVRGVRVDRKTLSAYRRACGFSDSPHLPITYPQVLAAPLHAAIMANPAFPFPMLGLVHVRSELRAFAPIPSDVPLDIACHVEGQREARSGIEFDLVTRVGSGSEPAWESITTVLARTGRPGKGPREERRVEAAGEPPGTIRSLVWRVPEDMGRRYAKVSGDYNPIHLTALSARLFGFKRAIAHGMWTLAKALAALEDVAPGGPQLVEASFRRPVFLPTTVSLAAQRTEDGLAFDVRGREGLVHVTGRIHDARALSQPASARRG